jgi:hypothetical protein
MPADSGLFRIAASPSGRAFRRGANANVGACLWGTPTPRQVAASAFVGAQVLGNYALVSAE